MYQLLLDVKACFMLVLALYEDVVPEWFHIIPWKWCCYTLAFLPRTYSQPVVSPTHEVFPILMT